MAVRSWTVLLSVLMIVAAAGIAYYVTMVLPLGGRYSSTLGALERGGMSSRDAVTTLQELTGSSLLSSTLWALFSTLIAIGVVSLFWEMPLRSTWLRVVQESLTQLLLRPDVLRFTSARDLDAALREILQAIHGDDLGDALYRSRLDGSIRDQRLKEHFEYNITLCPHPTLAPDFHAATIYLEFDVRSLPKTLGVETARLQDSLELHKKYHDLTSGSEAMYRYILLSTKDVDLSTHFVLGDCQVSALEGNDQAPIQLVPAAEPCRADGRMTVRLKPGPGFGPAFQRIRGGRCRMKMTISTVVDSARREFPILLGYPVNQFRSTFDATRCGVSRVDAVEFFSSPHRYVRTDTPASCSVVAGHLDDYILPDSGLIYTWSD